MTIVASADLFYLRLWTTDIEALSLSKTLAKGQFSGPRISDWRFRDSLWDISSGRQGFSGLLQKNR